MKDKLVKRKQVNWRDALLELGDSNLERLVWRFKSEHRLIGHKRCAYYVLCKCFSKQDIDFYREHGYWDQGIHFRNKRYLIR